MGEHQKELKIQNMLREKTPKRAVQATEHFIVNDEKGQPIALVEIQENVKVAQDVLSLPLIDPLTHKIDPVNQEEHQKVRTDIQKLKNELYQKGLYLCDDGPCNFGYHNGVLKIIDSSNVKVYPRWEETFTQA